MLTIRTKINKPLQVTDSIQVSKETRNKKNELQIAFNFKIHRSLNKCEKFYFI